MKPISFHLILLACAGTTGAQTLKALATSRGIHMGAAVTSNARSAEYNRVLSTEFNAMVAENAMKFGNIEPSQNNFTWTTADALVNFAQTNGMAMRGHNFVWHNQAGWAATFNGTRAQMLAIMKNHILTVGGRYAGRIYEWDVVNEGVDDNGANLRASFWQQRIGDDYIDSAFVYARQADPNALLVYNDYGAEPMNAKSNYVYNLVSGLKSRGIPIHGVGLQCHFSLNSFDTVSMDANMRRIEALGLGVSITELDITTSNTAANLATQKANYKAMMALCLRHPGCKTFITWGVNDAQSWRGAGAVPLLFTGTTTITPKPAYDGVVEALAAVTGIRKTRNEGSGAVWWRSPMKMFDVRGRRLTVFFPAACGFFSSTTMIRSAPSCTITCGSWRANGPYSIKTTG